MARTRAEQKVIRDKVVRAKIVRYMAFSGMNTYNYVGDFSLQCGCLKKDVQAVTQYYIDEGWMHGHALTSSSNGICDLNHLYRCAVLAYTSIKDAQYFLEKAEKIEKSHYFYRGSNGDIKILTKALNIYCNAFPETRRVFEDIDMSDFDDNTATEKDTKAALDMWKQFKDTLANKNYGGIDLAFLAELFLHPEFFAFFHVLPKDLTITLFDNAARTHSRLEFLTPKDYSNIEDFVRSIPEGSPTFMYKESFRNSLLFYHQFLRNGDVDMCLDQMKVVDSPHVVLRGIKYLQQGCPNDAFKCFDDFLKKLAAFWFNDSFCCFIYGLSILLADTKAASRKAEALLKKRALKENNQVPFFKFLLMKKTQPDMDFEKWINESIGVVRPDKMGAALFYLVCVHYGYHKAFQGTVKVHAEKFLHSGMNVLALNFVHDTRALQSEEDNLRRLTKMKPLLPDVRIQEPWENLIDAMMLKYDTEGNGTAKKKTVVKQEVARVAYRIDDASYSVQPVLQKSKNGGVTWSGGRNIALKNFQKGIPEMTAQDTRIALLVESYSYGWYGGTTLSLSGVNVVEALIGHPYVFSSANPDIKIEIQEEKLQIQVKETVGGYKVSFNVDKGRYGQYEDISVYKENAQLLKVIRLSKDEKDILTMLDRIGTFPVEAKDKLTQLLSVLGKKVTVMSPLLKNAENVKQKKGDSKLTVQLVPYGDMFSVRCFVKPLTSIPPYCQPGKGLEFLAANVKGETVQVTRNLTAERRNYKAFCEWMAPFDEYQSDDSWQMPIESCLEVLDLLREHKDMCAIEWPEGVKFSVSRPQLNSNDLHISVNSIGHWFEVDGEVKIDDKQMMKISELLKRVREAKGRFIQVGDAEYIALSKQLQKQLSALDHIMQTDHKQLKIASFNSSFLQDLASSGADMKVDKSYKEMLQRMEEADTMKIAVPKTLQADLRDYQKDGYRWLCRLAHWGAGACLADDMGLGKTIQTIALLLAHAKEGASLVVMPTSVLINWRNELARFAPSLNAILLRDASDRAEAIKSAGAQDVVLTTYGLLPMEEENLQSKKWNVIVLDEAHNIKNKETKTSHAAMTLDGKFRLLLTGTPLQNHLSEIWNLFQFATPGLLTGYTQFTQEFINPIEKEHDKNAQRLLKRMLQPFILRRTKSEVLSELPEKTEITLKVELSDAERALYDRFREEAVLNLEEGSSTAIRALAELTKLRQTACNAALVLPAKEAKDIPSSKMEAFLKLVDELMVNHHRALVFSQFTSHLALVEKELKKRNIEYQYLDGSVSPTERIARVADFQKGDMPLFLISLKAGGIGLNLTAADYVIHLDPWWNPAIEDQASDRAYRIGQDKPVTVYRIIAENTIEEKIIALHQTKKSLADALLEGSDMAYALGKDEILELIRGI